MKTPFLNALQAFEASYRHQSFSAAAEELNVTPAAVGQLVKNLEDWLGKPLFIRKSGGKARLQATEVATQAITDIHQGLEYLALGLKKMRDYQGDHRLNVSVSPILAMKWLLPRLSDFQSQHPDIEFFLNTSMQTIDYFSENIDIGIRYGKGKWQGLQAEHWQDEWLFPVCSQEFKQRYRILKPSDLFNLPLIHDQTLSQAQGFLGWQDWFNTHLPLSIKVQGLVINDSAAVIQSAINGQGVALGRSLLVKDDLANGRLVRLFPELNLRSPLAYYLVYRPENCQRPNICRFRDWLNGQ